MIKQNIAANYFLFADYFICSNQILILIKDFGDTSQNVICELGRYDNEQSINIEYFLDNKEISDSEIFKNKLIDNGISYIVEKINKSKNNEIDRNYKKVKKGKKSKKSKSYKFDENDKNEEKDKNEIEFIEFDFDNKNNENSPIIIHKIKNETKIIHPNNEGYIKNENTGDTEMDANKNAQDEINAQTEPNNIPKKVINNNKHSDFNNISTSLNPPGTDSQNKNGKKQRRSKAQDLKYQTKSNPEEGDNCFKEPHKNVISDDQQHGKDCINKNQEKFKTNLGNFVGIASNKDDIIVKIINIRN